MDFISTSASGDADVSRSKAPETTPKPLPKLDTADGRAEILRRANDGEKDALRLVGPTLDRDRREGGDLVDDYGDMFRYACLAMALVATDESEPYFTATIEKVEALSEELAGPKPTPLERILCERVALTWLDTYSAEMSYSDTSGDSVRVAACRESRRDRAHKRFLAACKALATVRRLGIPSVVVNQVVARQDVNVGGVASIPS